MPGIDSHPSFLVGIRNTDEVRVSFVAAMSVAIVPNVVFAAFNVDRVAQLIAGEGGAADNWSFPCVNTLQR